jgi:hypothetical protein
MFDYCTIFFGTVPLQLPQQLRSGRSDLELKCASVTVEDTYGQVRIHRRWSPVEVETSNTLERSRPQRDVPLRRRYRPAVFFRHLSLTVLSLPQGKIRALQGCYNLYFAFFFYKLHISELD